jgi:hypothetical protein
MKSNASGWSVVSVSLFFLSVALMSCSLEDADDSRQAESDERVEVSDAALDCADALGQCVVSGSSVPQADEISSREVEISTLPSRYPFWVLQLNLCNSGFAGCYENGASVPEAAAVIQRHAPDVVTLNEVCQNDVVALHATLADVYSGSTVVWAFKAANDKRTGGPYKCKNGQDYGVGVLAHIPAPYAGYQTYSGVYPMQDSTSNEHRAWLCIAATGNYYACTTHLTNNSGSTALNQCNHLMRTAIPAMQAAAGGARPTVMGADLNLRYGGSPNAQSCVPPGYYRKGDGSVQHIMASADLTFHSSAKITMQRTDHDGWFLKLTAP